MTSPEPDRAPGTVRMAERLALLAERSSEDPHAFQNHERVTRIERSIAAAGAGPTSSERFELARELLWAGRTEEAIDHFRSLREASAAKPELAPALGSWHLAAMTVGDYPDGVPAPWRIEPAVFESEGVSRPFHDVALESGVATPGLAGGSALEDFDGDGDLDLMVSSWEMEDPLRYFVNQGDGRFEERTREAGLVGITGGLNLVHADFDNDGWIDLFVGNESFSGRAHPSELFRNQGESGGFVDVAAEAGAAIGDVVKGVAAGDADNDGLVDLYLSRLLEPNVLLRNVGSEGEIRFEDASSQAGVGEPLHGFPTWFFDFDDDGWLDLFAGGYAGDYASASAEAVVADLLGLEHEAETQRLYRNRAGGAGLFDDVTADRGLDRVLLAMGANHGDLDNDGYLDLYLGTGAPSYRALVPNVMFRNASGQRFEDVTTAGGFGHLQKGHAISWGDVDGDGDQDVFEVIGGAYPGDVYPNVLFRNSGHGHRHLTVRLRGNLANRSALAARVRVAVATPAGPRDLHALVGTGGSFGSSSLQQEIGLGEPVGIESLQVRWPGSGRVQRFLRLATDRVLDIPESTGDSG